MKRYYLSIVFSLFIITLLKAQGQMESTFEIRYNQSTCLYEAHLHVGGTLDPFGLDNLLGPSGFTLVVPASVPDAPIFCTTLNPAGATWTDNTPAYNILTFDGYRDYHKFATNGSQFVPSLVVGDDIILFTFSIPGAVCPNGIRMFENNLPSPSPTPDTNPPTLTFDNSLQNVWGETYIDNLGSPIVLPPPSASSSYDFLCNNTDLYLTGTGSSPLTCTTLSYNWTGPGGFTSDQQNPIVSPAITPGTYILTVTDGNNCTAVESVTVSPFLTLGASATTESSTCGYSNGSVDLTAGGGTPPYSYSWSNGEISEDLSNVAAGTYTVTVLDDHGCTAEATAIVNNTDGPTASISFYTDVLCFGNATGSAIVQPNGGTPPYTYLWSTVPTQSSATAINLAAGTYYVTVYDFNSCPAITSVTISQPAQELSASGVPTNSTCGYANGSVDLFVSGGTEPYQFTWSNGEITEDLSNVLAGTYNVTVLDNHGCSTTTSGIVNNIPGPTASISSYTDVLCFGEATGSATVETFGGTPPFSYTWSTIPAQTSAMATNLAVGTYTVTVYDFNNCPATTSVTISQPAEELNASAVPGSSTCGYANGSVDLTVSGGTSPYSFSWSNGAISEDLSNVSAGIYSVTVWDDHGCSETASATVNDIPGPSASISGYNDVLCFGNATGSATVQPIGGTPPFSYLWSTVPAQSSPTAINLPAGNYWVTVYDFNNCSATTSVTISQPAQELSASAVPASSTCGYANGSVNLSVSGGTAPYSFFWSNGTISEDLTNVAAGAYDVTITDDHGCSTTASAIVNDIPGPSASIISQIDVLCFGQSTGSATVQPIGGTPPFSYSWSTVPAQTSATAINLAAGTYTVTVYDFNNCSATTGVIISQPTEAISAVALGSNSTCGYANGSADLTVSGGTPPYSFTWSNGDISEDLANVLAGNYSVTVSDDHGCSETASVTVFDTPGPSLSIINQINVLCENSLGSATVQVSGGTQPFSYVWNTIPVQTSATAIDLPIGTYSVVVTDSNNCTASISVNIIQDYMPQAYAGYDQEWCNTTTTFLVGSPSQPAGNWTQISGPNIATVFPPDYAVASVTHMIPGIYQFVYTIAVTNNNEDFCFSSDTMTVINYDIPSVSYAGPDQTLCLTSGLTTSTTLTGNTPAYGTGTWLQVFGPTPANITNPLSPVTTVSNLAAGDYEFNWVISNGNCEANYDYVHITINDGPVANAGPDGQICQGVAYPLNGATAANYQSLTWVSSGTGTFSNPVVLNPTYTPSAADAAAGSVMLILSANGKLSCPNAYDTLILTVTPHPVFNCPLSFTQAVDSGTCSAMVIDTISGSIINSGCVTGVINSYTLTNNASGVYPLGTTIVTWTVTYLDGTIATCTQTITIIDNRPPVITCPQNITQSTIPGQCNANVAIINPTATDNCYGNITFTGIRSDGLPLSALFPIGVTSIIWTATDASGNVSLPCTQTVTIIDNTPPIITCPQDITQYTVPGQCSANVNIINPTAIDNCFTTITFTGVRSDVLPLTDLYPIGVTTITWTATDGSGNSSMPCIQTITIIDNIPPVITCPQNITQAATQGQCSANITITNPTATDNCSTTFTFTGIRSDGLALNAPYPVGVTTITWTATDGSGNVSIPCIQTVTVIDTEIPVITCPSDISLSTYPGQCYAYIQIINPSATDNCSNTFTFNGIRSDALPIYAPYPIGTTTITWTAVDAHGNSSISCIQTVTVTDNTPPVITCPSNITQTTLPGQCGANVNVPNPTAIDNCFSAISFTGTRSDGLALNAMYPVGVTTITWIATDGAGNSSMPCQQTVTIIDNIPPVIICPQNITQAATQGLCSANITITDPTATDNCSTTFTFTGIRSDGLALNAPFPLGITTITWTAIDAAGNHSFPCVQLITVIDTTPPVITCPQNITQSTIPGQCNANVAIINPTATDNCYSAITFTGIRTDGLPLSALYPVGITTITWTATDAAGNTSTPCVQTVTIIDNTPPVITCPQDITQNTDQGLCSAHVTIVNPTATDNCFTTITFTGVRSDLLPLTDPYPVGVTTISWTATDGSGNSSMPCIQTITIIDNVPPVITCPQDITLIATQGQCSANATITNPTATDNCSTTFTFTGIRSDGLALNAPYPVGVTTITWTATDGSGNVSIPCIQTVTVIDNTPPVITCPQDITVSTMPGQCFANVAIVDPTATDNCFTTISFTGVRSDGLPLSALFPIGVTTITWIATDASGNSSNSCLQTITVNDNTPPVITCPADITKNTDPGMCSANITITYPTATDNCSTYITFAGTRSDGLPLTDPYPVGVTTISWIATDAAGNSSMPCLQTITIIDNVPPVITCPQDITVTTLQGQCFANVSVPNPTATDNCSTTITFTGVRSDGLSLSEPYPIGITTITWIAADGSGNSSVSCIQTVTVTENVPPVITCPPNITVAALDGQCFASVTPTNPTATDNCSTTFTFTGVRSDGLLLTDPYHVGVTTITWIATDASGNSSVSCIQTITVTEDTPPLIVCPHDITQITSEGMCAAEVPIVDPTGIDVCSGTITFTGVRSDNLPLYDPFPAGVTIITWTATDASGNTSIPCLQYITVYSPPIANIDYATTDEDVPVVIDVLENDTDCDNNINPATVNTYCPECSDPANGTITIDLGTGEITYTPDPNFNGTDTLIYQVCDAGNPILCDTAMVIITVEPVNDPPIVNDSTVTIPHDSTITVCLPIFDIDGPTPFILTNTGCFENGEATAVVNGNEVCITYTPDSTFTGTDTVCVTICDGAQACDIGLLIIHVLPPPEKPVIGLAKNVISIVKQHDGSFNVTFGINVENLGNEVLHNVQVTDDLSETFPAPATFSMVSGPIATGHLVEDISFNGTTDINLLEYTSYLEIGEISQIEFTVNVNTHSFKVTNYLNFALGYGVAESGEFVTDTSNNGVNPDPNGNGIANEPGENEPTPFKLEGMEFYIPDGFSPNDDGINDLFVIKGVDNYPDNKISVFNRWGNLIYEKENYMNTWDATPNRGILTGKGKVQPGTYYYIFEFNSEDMTPAKGYIIVQY